MSTLIDPSGNNQALKTTSAVTHDTLLLTTGLTIASGTQITSFQSGTFTIGVEGTGTAGSPTYTVQVGRYWKINKLVYILANVAWSASGGMVGNLRLTGLPFTVENTSSLDGIGPSTVWGINQALAPGAGNIPLLSFVPNTTKVNVAVTSETLGTVALQPVSSTGSISINGAYVTV